MFRQAALEIADGVDLGAFFDRIHECRDKTDHVHGMHPYPAKFIPHIPRALIEALAAPGSTVLDPMCGSGTTLVEATIAGHDAVGIDLNPIAALVSRAKTAILSNSGEAELTAARDDLERGCLAVSTGTAKPAGLLADETLPNFHNRDKWFERNVALELQFALERINKISDRGARDVALCAFSAIIVSASNQESETRWCAKPNPVPDGTTLARLVRKLADCLQRSLTYRQLARGDASVHLIDARANPLADASVDLVVTSPPYANSHDYYLYNKLRLFWLGHDVAPVQAAEIGSRNRHSDLREDIASYVDGMTGVLSEVTRVLRPGGHAAIVVADAVIRGDFFDMRDVFSTIAQNTGLELVQSYRFAHKQFNSAFQTGFGTKRSKHTHVLILQS